MVDVNSLNDHIHQPESYHWADLAVDLDTEGDRGRHLDNLYRFLTQRLHAPYQVIYEGDHIHVEFDIREYRTD